MSTTTIATGSQSETPAAEQSAPGESSKGPKIHWAAAPGPVKKFDLEEQYEVAKARNWISERLISQSQKHWHCSREEAIERLLAQHR